MSHFLGTLLSISFGKCQIHCLNSEYQATCVLSGIREKVESVVDLQGVQSYLI